MFARSLAVMLVVLAGCATPGPELLVSLPRSCNTPDGMTLSPDGTTVFLSCPNFNVQRPGTPEGTLDPLYPGVIVTLGADGAVTNFCTLPAHPETRKAGPMGLDLGPDGSLYVADNQYFYDQNGKSRLVRIALKDGKPAGADTVVEGFNLANAVIWRADHVYVSDTFLDIPGRPGSSGVYRFTLSELETGPVRIRPGGEDPHLLAQFTTTPRSPRNDTAGADGLVFDNVGNLYVGSFGDGVIYKLTFDGRGDVASQTVLVGDPKKIPCVDGLCYDAAIDGIYVADSERNAVHLVTPDGDVSTIWENEDTDGAGGALDQPCEVLVRGNELLVVSFDMPFPGLKNTAFDAPYTVSVFALDR